MRHPPLATAAIALMAGAVGLAGCNQQAAKPARGENATSAAAAASDASATVSDSSRKGDRAGRRGDRANRDGAMHSSGSPMWAGNRKRPAEDNAKRMFERNGKDFGATSVDDYVDKAHDFVSSPPSGVKTATRANGDKLFYDPASNTFAAVNRRGAPRIMMKPREGAAYWTEQLASLDERKGGRRNRQARQGADTAAEDDAG